MRGLEQLQRGHLDLYLGLGSGHYQVPKHFDIVLHRHGIEAVGGSECLLQPIAHMRVVKYPRNSRVRCRKLEFGLLSQSDSPLFTFHGLHSSQSSRPAFGLPTGR